MTTTTTATTLWLRQHLDQRGLTYLYRYVGARLPKSKALGKVEGHVHGKIMALMRNDGLRHLIDAGKPVDAIMRALGHYCVHGALSEITREGRNPVCRALHGARTTTEVASGTDAAPIHGSAATPILAGDEALLDVGVEEMGADEALTLREGLDKITEVIRASKRRDAAERFVRIAENQMLGLSLSELADLEGVGYDRAASMVHELRCVMRRARLRGRIAAEIVRYLDEEPWATEMDILEDIHVDEDVPGVSRKKQEDAKRNLILQALRWLEDHNKISKIRGSFVLADGATAWAEAHANSPIA